MILTQLQNGTFELSKNLEWSWWSEEENHLTQRQKFSHKEIKLEIILI